VFSSATQLICSAPPGTGGASLPVALYRQQASRNELISSPVSIVYITPCPGTPSCSGQGTCVAGTCSCAKGYASADCSVQVFLATVAVTGVAAGGSISVPLGTSYTVRMSACSRGNRSAFFARQYV
jgi:hypothetical protein